MANGLQLRRCEHVPQIAQMAQANVLALDHKHQVVAAPRAVDIVVLGLDARHGEPARLVRAGRIEQDVVPFQHLKMRVVPVLVGACDHVRPHARHLISRTFVIWIGQQYAAGLIA